MKILHFLVLALMIFSINTSCSENENLEDKKQEENNEKDEEEDGDDNNPTSLRLIHGTWEEVKRESYKDGVIIPDHWSKWAKWTFKKDGSAIHHSPSYVDRGTYTYNDNVIRTFGENRTVLKLTVDSLIWKKHYPDDEYDYQILYLKRTTSEYDDPFEENIVSSYTGNVKKIIDKYKDMRPFIGRWYSGNNYYVFTSDQKCEQIYNGFQTANGIWNYNSLTKVLGTTMNLTWNITITSTNQWAGTSTATGKTISLTRVINTDTNKYFSDSNKELLVGEWKKEDGTVIYIDENYNYQFKYNAYSKIESGSGKIGNDLYLENLKINSISGSVFLLGKTNSFSPKRLEGIYVLQNK